MHMYRGETNFYGGNAIVGAQVPMAAGIALAQKVTENLGLRCDVKHVHTMFSTIIPTMRVLLALEMELRTKDSCLR